MARSSLVRALRRLYRDFNAADSDAGPSTRGSTRAAFLAGAAAAVTTPPVLARTRQLGAVRSPQVVIVGAGVAGLLCAYRLQQAGIASRVYEGNDRIGGRTWTLRGFFSEGQIAEHGGEFISTNQEAARLLVRELGLDLINVNHYEPGKDIYYFNDSIYPIAQAKADYSQVHPTIERTLDEAGYPTTYESYTRAGRALDRTSVANWIEANVPGGARSKLGQLLGVSCVQEYGGDTSVQSALNLLYLFGFDHRGHLNPDGSNEALHVAGGNDQIAARMAAALPNGSVETGTALIALRERADGTYRCTFEAGKRTFDVDADCVCLAIPFTTLRHVDTRNVAFSAVKRLAIDRLPMGSNAKLHLQFSRRIWNEQHYDGSSYTQFPYQVSWDVSAAQAGKAGILVGFPGGREGELAAPAHGPAPEHLSRAYLAEFEHLYPGIGGLWTGAAYLDAWVNDPWHFGSYAYYGVGDYTSFAGVEGEPEKNVFFCGEQTSYRFQGYINGAVVSGARAAREIAALS